MLIQKEKTSGIGLHKIWTAAICLYLVCSITFFAGDYVFISSVSLYFFLCVSVLNLLVEQKFKMNWFLIFLLFYAACIFISSIWTPVSTAIVKANLYNYITMIIVVFCTYNFVKDTRDIEWILFSVMVGGFCLSLYVYSFYGLSMFYNLSSSASEFRIGSELDMDNVNQIGLLTVFGALIATYFLLYGKKTFFMRLACLLCLAATVLITLLTGSKKAYLMLLVGLFLLIAFRPKSKAGKSGRFVYFSIAAFIVLVAIVLIYHLSIFHTVKLRMDEMWSTVWGHSGNISASDQTRIDMLKTGLRSFLDNPIMGEGFASSYAHFGTYSHNNYIEILMNTGIVGFLLFYIPYGTILIQILKKWKRFTSLDLVLATVFFLIVFGAIGYVYYYDRPTQILMCLVYLNFVNLFKQEKENPVSAFHIMSG